MSEDRLDEFEDLFEQGAGEAHRDNPGQYEAVAGFWATPLRRGVLSAKVKALVGLALHASPSTLNRPGIEFHVRRALEAGATPEEIRDVFVSICPLGVHTFGFAIPALREELEAAGRNAEAELPPLREDVLKVKNDFIRNRGYWTDERENIGALMPDFFKAYMNLSYEPWRNGALEPKVREFIFIAIDSSITHMYPPGLRLHMRNALKLGATREEILEVFEIVATLGASTYAEGVSALFRVAGPVDRRDEEQP